MPVTTWIIIITVLFLVVLSVRERVKISQMREKDWDVIGESKSTPLSRAITNLVGMAGGIYLSMVLLFTFLEVQLPARVTLGTVKVEPLAAISIILAIIQPFVLKMLQMRNRF